MIGTALKRVGSGFVKRQPAQRAGRDTLTLLDALLAGDSLAIFPEGEFSPDAGVLPFRERAFLLAAKAEVPVVPVALFGTRRVLPEPGVLPRASRVTVDILHPVYPGGTDHTAVARLRHRG